jgi:hypothetical protein
LFVKKIRIFLFV